MADPEIPISETPMPENPISENPISGYLISGSGGGELGEVDRRTVLKALAIAGPAFAIPLASEGRYALLARQTRAALPGSPAKKFSFQAVRAEDMLYLAFEFYNCKRVVRHSQTFVVPLNATIPALMVVIFQPQHIGEQSVKASVSTKSYPFPPLHGALAGNSWLAFELPKHATIPLTIEGLLTWAHLNPQLVPVVASPSTGFPAAPDPVHTALEVPWGLWISPPKGGTWQHAVSPVSSGGRTELWHTRLGVHGVEPPHVAPKIKAFWSTTYAASLFGPPPPDPFFMSLSPTDRDDIVALTCGIVLGGKPAVANFLALSPLGATINIQGEWNPDPHTGVSLHSWIHRASLGRDSYVRIVNLGYLFPFGNRAVKIKITDREFHADPNGDVVAYLVTREFIVVTQPTISYKGDANEPFKGRGNPIRQVTIKTAATPPIDFDPVADPGILVGSVDPTAQFVLWVRSGGTDIPFACTVTDIEGRNVDITTSLIWVDGAHTDSGTIGSIRTAYDGAGQGRNTPAFAGAMFAFAETDGAPVGSTAHHVSTYTLSAEFASNGGSNFYPMLNSAQISLPGAEQLVGAGSPSAGADLRVHADSTSLPSPSVFIHDHYKNNGFPAGVTEVYLAILNNAPSLGFPVNLVGGLAPPNFDVSGLARDIGPVAGDLTKLLGGMFDPTQYFSVLSGGIGKLLGAINIADIISAVGVADASSPVKRDSTQTNAQAPQITNNLIYPNNDMTQLPTGLDTKLTWQPKVKGDPFGIFKPNNSKLLITAEIMVPIAQPTQATYKIHGELNDFELVLFGDAASFIGITFTSLTFDSGTGAKTSIQPKIDKVTFLGPLTFIQDLEQLLASIGGPSIDVSASGIMASYSLALPDVTVGVFSLSNLSINAGLNIPFDGSPVRVRFGLCTQDNPFLLTVWIFGGGGFFSLALGADGIEQLQVQLEFGAAVSIDLGVASGGVSIMAGIYFSLQTVPTKQIMLTGFLRADGNLSILGIISISLEFYLALTYLDPGQAYGEATVKVSISVLFFSTTVSATMRKTLGGGHDPNFRQAITQSNWDTYCEAFAA